MAVDLQTAVVWYVIFIISIVLHEGGHALVAYWGGDETAYAGGQVSLNPIPHIQREPIGTVLFPIFFIFSWGWPFGWASAPYDPHWEQQYPRRSGWMAAAGPGANFLLALLAALSLHIGFASGVFDYCAGTYFHIYAGATQFWDNAARFLSMSLYLNLILGLFNLVPVPPLDGSSVLSLFMPEETARNYLSAIHTGAIGMIGLLVAWLVFPRVKDLFLLPLYGLLGFS